MGHSIFYPYPPPMDGAKFWGKKTHGFTYGKIQLDFQHLPYPYGWCLNIKSMDLPMDDLIIEKSSWKSNVFHRYKSHLQKNPDTHRKYITQIRQGYG